MGESCLCLIPVDSQDLFPYSDKDLFGILIMTRIARHFEFPLTLDHQLSGSVFAELGLRAARISRGLYMLCDSYHDTSTILSILKVQSGLCDGKSEHRLSLSCYCLPIKRLIYLALHISCVGVRFKELDVL
jgi:hypothetical protein